MLSLKVWFKLCPPLNYLYKFVCIQTRPKYGHLNESIRTPEELECITIPETIIDQ